MPGSNANGDNASRIIQPMTFRGPKNLMHNKIIKSRLERLHIQITDFTRSFFNLKYP